MDTENKKEKVTAKGVVLLILAILGLCGIAYLMLNMGEDKTSATYEQVWDGLTEYGCTAIDNTEYFKGQYPELDFEYAISCRDEYIYIDFFKLNNLDDANTAYRRFNSVINNNYSKDAIDASEQMRNYIIRTYSSEGEYSYLMRIDNTVFYGECSKENAELLNKIAASFGYSV